jgi:hypothetical protein
MLFENRRMSSLHGLHVLGYKCVTMVFTISNAFVKFSKSVKNTLVQIVLCKLEHEVGIASNRKSACYGEYVNKSGTHRPSRPDSLF